MHKMFILFDSEAVAITAIPTERPNPDADQPDFLYQSTVFTHGFNLEATEDNIAAAKQYVTAALELAAQAQGNFEVNVPTLPHGVRFNRNAGCCCGCCPGWLTFARVTVAADGAEPVQMDLHVDFKI